ncbi:Helix-turn-helix domain-containing protein [Actinopolymorpha cephalotaxi]|uniref:DNA-binding transcriptional ArsR family regulator n=1 Tax=Actinopolymorpha cephalotaxi TaxID=504797 RepID=A0A1I3AI31_9ACTN|nr:winged helix-turn-helix domain-containing protein [Actinopolymorpha cephalotaxi]NYH82165.1 DNA-binding transcriptional ArsR family regulator [Actinopolymorpha cephalotaxi]SFH49663.1 Helix-turn-helix domain-containing protein [Actinopolymorpha cephalotaxi]
MLRIEFTTQDLNRLRVSGDVHPLWETVLSLQLLQNRHAALTFDPWRRQVRAALARSGLVPTTTVLTLVCPHAEYFPDFLTPGNGCASLDEGLDTVLSTPKPRLEQELSRLAPQRAMPPVIQRLARGEPTALRWLGESLRRYYDAAVAPYLQAIRATMAADRPRRSDAALAGGAEGLLATYQNELTWRGDALECAYPVDQELILAGRPLSLVPSFFCARRPVTLADPDLPPVLVHPLRPAPGWLDAPTDPASTLDALGQLLGHTRAQVLDLLDVPMSTGRIAAELHLAPASASRHATVLREAGLLTSQRQQREVLHRRTPLGDAMLNGVLHKAI